MFFPPSKSSFTWEKRGVAFLLVVHLLVTAAMASAPRFHEWLHPDAGHHSTQHDQHQSPEHACVVTMLQSGSVDAPGQPVDFVHAPDRALLSQVSELSSADVASLYLSGAFLTRGPPVVG